MGRHTRRSQEERSADTRARLRAATLETLLDYGYARTSTVEICKRAGLSRGAMLHHYPTKTDLIIDTARHRFERARVEMEQLALGFGRGELTIDAFIAGMWEQVFPVQSVVLTLETLVAARADPELDRVIGGFLADMLKGYEAVATTAFAQTGFSAEQRHVLVLLTACTVRGLRYQQLMHSPPEVVALVRQALKYSLESVLAAGPEKLSKAIAPPRRLTRQRKTARTRQPNVSKPRARRLGGKS
jgi:AcrR family transcriptional regulator